MRPTVFSDLLAVQHRLFGGWPDKKNDTRIRGSAQLDRELVPYSTSNEGRAASMSAAIQLVYCGGKPSFSVLQGRLRYDPISALPCSAFRAVRPPPGTESPGM